MKFIHEERQFIYALDQSSDEYDKLRMRVIIIIIIIDTKYFGSLVP